MSSSIFHDAVVFGVSYLELEKSLILTIQANDKSRRIGTFSGIYDFSLDNFGTQNVLFDIVKYDDKLLPMDESELMFPGLTAQVIEFAKANHLAIYILEPSCGMSGYVVASDLKIS